MVAVFLMAILYEGLKTLREWLIYYDLKRSKKMKKIKDEMTLAETSNTKGDKTKLLDNNIEKRPSR